MRRKIKLDDLCAKAEEYTTFSCKPEGLKKYRLGTVLDENKTVKWNNQELERLNALYNEEVVKLKKKKNRLREDLVKLIKRYIIQETKVSDDRATKIFDYLYELASNKPTVMFFTFNTLIDELDGLLDLFK